MADTITMEASLYITVIVILLFTASIQINIYLDYDIFENCGNISLTIFHIIPILRRQISIQNGYILLISKKRIRKVKLDINDKSVHLVRELNNHMKSKIYTTKLATDFYIGCQNPQICSLIAGYINVIEGMLFAKIKAREVDTDVSKNINISYTQDKIMFLFDYRFVATIFDYIWSLWVALYRVRRRFKHVEK